MTARNKVVLGGSVAVLFSLGWLAWPYVSLSYSVRRALHEQDVQNGAAKPLFDAVVTKKLKVGDSLERAKEVLNYAGLSFDVVCAPFPHPMVQSIYRAGRWSGFTIQLELDSSDSISKIDIHEYFTGP
jgi:hypothetical protein